jgi:hypothetical protein
MDLHTVKPAMVQGCLCCQSGIRIECCEPSYQRFEVIPIFFIATDGLIPLPERERPARITLSKSVSENLKHLCPRVALNMMQYARQAIRIGKVRYLACNDARQ